MTREEKKMEDTCQNCGAFVETGDLKPVPGLSFSFCRRCFMAYEFGWKMGREYEHLKISDGEKPWK